ncbi:hypothetical protein IFM89_028142, partial [Coptis chinensis]
YDNSSIRPKSLKTVSNLRNRYFGRNISNKLRNLNCRQTVRNRYIDKYSLFCSVYWLLNIILSIFIFNSCLNLLLPTPF